MHIIAIQVKNLSNRKLLNNLLAFFVFKGSLTVFVPPGFVTALKLLNKESIDRPQNGNNDVSTVQPHHYNYISSNNDRTISGFCFNEGDIVKGL